VDGKGYLHVRATYTTQGGGGPHWKVAHLASKAKLTPPYIVAVRAKVPPGAGMWSAPAWTTSWDNGGCAEVDVVEQLGRQPLGVNQTLHNLCGMHRYLTRYSSPTDAPLASGFHEYAAVVQPDRVDYLVDRKRTATIWASWLGTGLATPSTFHISLNVGTCWSWAGCPPTGAPSPVEMVVDWFRVYSLP
jgi:beta-glucanase (GH16 family)